MLHYVHQLVSICVCLLFAAEKAVYSGFIEFFLRKQLPDANDAMRRVSMNQNSKAVVQTVKQWAETHYNDP